MAGIAKYLWRSVPLFVLSAGLFAAQVGPHDAKMHVVEWWERTGYCAPDFLRHPYIDAQVTLICVVLFIAWGLMLLLLHRREQRRETKPATYMSPYDVVTYMADESRWGRRQDMFRGYDPEHSAAWGRTIIEKKNPRINAPSEFASEAARKGTPIVVFGTDVASGKITPIPHLFWMGNIFDWQTCTLPGMEGSTKPSLSQMPMTAPSYRKLQIDGAGVRKVWPPVPQWLKIWDKVLDMTGNDTDKRFDRLLKTMTQGEKPSARKSASTDQASGAASDACSSDTQTPPDTSEDASR